MRTSGRGGRDGRATDRRRAGGAGREGGERAAGATLAWLPFRWPELNPCEDLWRRLKATVAANRDYASVDLFGEHASAWLEHLLPADLLRLASLRSRKFDWLPT